MKVGQRSTQELSPWNSPGGQPSSSRASTSASGATSPRGESYELKPLSHAVATSLASWQPRLRRHSTGVAQPFLRSASCRAQMAMTPPDSELSFVTRSHSLREVPLLPSNAQCPSWRQQFSALEQRVHKQMGPWALHGFSKFTDVGKGIALTVGAIAGMLTFVVGPHHLVLAVGVASIVYAGFVIIGLMVEFGLKLWTYRKVDARTREELRDLCEELNARGQEFGSSRSLEEQALSHAANSLWTDIHFSGRAVMRTLAKSVADWQLEPCRPLREHRQPKQKSQAPQLGLAH